MSAEVNIVNLTKNDLTIISRNGEEIILKSVEELKVNLVREEDKYVSCGDKGEIKINKTFFVAKSETMKKYPPKENTIYIVSPFVFNCIKDDRSDVYTTDEPIKKGQITIACKSLSRKTDVLSNTKLKNLLEFVKDKHANMVVDRKDLTEDYMAIIIEIQKLIN